MWLECIGVVSGCCCKEVYRYPHNWRAEATPPLSVEFAEFSLYLYIYIFIYIYIYIYIIYIYI